MLDHPPPFQPPENRKRIAGHGRRRGTTANELLATPRPPRNNRKRFAGPPRAPTGPRNVDPRAAGRQPHTKCRPRPANSRGSETPRGEKHKISVLAATFLNLRYLASFNSHKIVTVGGGSRDRREHLTPPPRAYTPHTRCWRCSPLTPNMPGGKRLRSP